MRTRSLLAAALAAALPTLALAATAHAQEGGTSFVCFPGYGGSGEAFEAYSRVVFHIQVHSEAGLVAVLDQEQGSTFNVATGTRRDRENGSFEIESVDLLGRGNASVEVWPETLNFELSELRSPYWHVKGTCTTIPSSSDLDALDRAIMTKTASMRSTLTRRDEIDRKNFNAIIDENLKAFRECLERKAADFPLTKADKPESALRKFRYGCFIGHARIWEAEVEKFRPDEQSAATNQIHAYVTHSDARATALLANRLKKLT